MVDPLGRVVTSLPLGTEGMLDARLPRPIAPTLYDAWATRLAVLMIAWRSLSWCCGAARQRDLNDRKACH